MVINFVGLEISIPTLIWTLINFLILLFVVNKFLFKPVIRFMDDRQERINKKLKIKSDADKIFEEDDLRLQGEISDANSEAFGMVQTARNEAEAEKDKAIRDAGMSAAREMEDSKDRVSEEEKLAKEKLDEQMPEYVDILKRKLLK